MLSILRQYLARQLAPSALRIPYDVQIKLDALFRSSDPDTNSVLEREVLSLLKSANTEHCKDFRTDPKVIPAADYLRKVLDNSNYEYYSPRGDVVVSPTEYYSIARRRIQIPRLVVRESLVFMPSDLDFLPFATVLGAVFLNPDAKITDVDLVAAGGIECTPM